MCSKIVIQEISRSKQGSRLCMAFMYLEKAYDRMDRNALWQVLRIYGVGGCSGMTLPIYIEILNT